MAHCWLSIVDTGHDICSSANDSVHWWASLTGYTIKLEELCRHQSFGVEQVTSCDLVYPKGAVPNPQILWVRVELTSGERKFITLPLLEFYRFVQLPESSIGGWTDGDRGSDYSGLNARYEVDHTGSDDKVSDELQLSPEGAEETVEARVRESREGGQPPSV